MNTFTLTNSVKVYSAFMQKKPVFQYLTVKRFCLSLCIRLCVCTRMRSSSLMGKSPGVL